MLPFGTRYVQIPEHQGWENWNWIELAMAQWKMDEMDFDLELHEQEFTDL